jgi:hypothetical protein
MNESHSSTNPIRVIRFFIRVIRIPMIRVIRFFKFA